MVFPSPSARGSAAGYQLGLHSWLSAQTGSESSLFLLQTLLLRALGLHVYVCIEQTFLLPSAGLEACRSELFKEQTFPLVLPNTLINAHLSDVIIASRPQRAPRSLQVTKRVCNPPSFNWIIPRPASSFWFSQLHTILFLPCVWQRVSWLASCLSTHVSRTFHISAHAGAGSPLWTRRSRQTGTFSCWQPCFSFFVG